MPFMLFGGIFANVSTIPAWIAWLEYLSVLPLNMLD